MKYSRLTAIILAAAFVLAMSGCKPRQQQNSEPAEGKSSVSEASQSKAETSKQSQYEWEIPDFKEQILQSKQINEDVIGWLEVPNTSINDVVLQNKENNTYYYRRNLKKHKEFNGVFWADYRSGIGDGSAEQLGMNTCIYGHSMTDDIENEKFSIKFGPLHFFRDEDFARHTPYIFFSTEKETYVWEIFAVFFADAGIVAYNRNDLPSDDIYNMIQTEILPRSIYNYNADISKEDKFLVLSTCVYSMPDGTYIYTDDSLYRYAIMARLIKSEEATNEFADFTVKDSYVIDPYK